MICVWSLGFCSKKKELVSSFLETDSINTQSLFLCEFPFSPADSDYIGHTLLTRYCECAANTDRAATFFHEQQPATTLLHANMEAF